MSALTGVLERVPAAYYSDERQAILESAREFAMKDVLPVANELDPVQGEIPDELLRATSASSFRRNTAASVSASSSTCW